MCIHFGQITTRNTSQIIYRIDSPMFCDKFRLFFFFYRISIVARMDECFCRFSLDWGRPELSIFKRHRNQFPVFYFFKLKMAIFGKSSQNFINSLVGRLVIYVLEAVVIIIIIIRIRNKIYIFSSLKHFLLHFICLFFQLKKKRISFNTN